MGKKMYTAKILYQFRAERDGSDLGKKKRLCMEQSVIFEGDDSETAYKKLEEYAVSGQQTQYWDKCKDIVIHMELVGILEFYELWDWIEEDDFHEVGHEFYNKVLPLERKDKLIPQKNGLREFEDEENPKNKRPKVRWS